MTAPHGNNQPGLALGSRSRVYGTVVGAGIGHLVATEVLGDGPLLPPARGGLGPMVVAGMIVVVPAVVWSRLFLEARGRIDAGALSAWTRAHPWVSVSVLAAVASVAVAVAPAVAGNGMEALRESSAEITVTVALSLALVKLVATTAALGAGAPGGVLTPTITVSAGWAALTLMAVDGLGWWNGEVWDGMLVAMAIGIAVGLRSRLVGMVMVAEMTGQIGLLPVFAVVVPVAWLLDHGIDRALAARGWRLPDRVYDEDA